MLEKNMEENKNIFESDTHSETTETKQNKSYFLPIIITFSVIALLAIATVGSLILIAYGKIDIKNHNLQEKVENIVMGISFMPKTPKYIFRQTYRVQQNIKQVNFDLSLATTSDNVTSMLGTNKFDLVIKGPINVADSEYPNMDINMMVTKELNVDIKAANKKGYIKLNKIPSIFALYMKIEPKDLEVFQNQWISFDLNPIDSEARKNIDASAKKESTKEKAAKKKLDEYLKKEIVPKMNMSKEQLDGKSMYKFVVTLNQIQVERIIDIVNDTRTVERKVDKDTSVEKITDSTQHPFKIEDFVLTFWINEKDYYMAKTVVAMNVKSEAKSSVSRSMIATALPFPTFSNESFDVVMVAKLKDINKPFNVEKPVGAISTDDFMQKIATSSAFGKSMYPYGAPSRLAPTTTSLLPSIYAVASDLKHVEIAALSYYKKEQKLPSSLNDLIVGTYLPTSFVSTTIQDRITFKVNKEQTKLFVYSSIVDPASSLRPYYGLEINAGKSNGVKHYSMKQIDDIQEALNSTNL